MKKEESIFGCFLKVGFIQNLSEKEFMSIADTFKVYIWGNKGVCNVLKQLNNNNYGQDLRLALFQFYVKPTEIELQSIKEIEPYRKKEKSIGIPIVINDDNFFNKSEEERYKFLKQSVLQKLDLLAEVVKKKKLDTNMEQLKMDLQNILN